MLGALNFSMFAESPTSQPESPDSATLASPRLDANSRLAHEQLVAKARQGGIDLYFLGDSITRRWGCSDPQYADLLANWRQNFHGWNAGNFGWGGDRIENILWRIENGELDGVNPKVIVLLAGTNNIGAMPGDDAKVQDIITGLKKLIATCKMKAPHAKLVITAIFPRNDNVAVLPEVSRVNESLEKMADGKAIFFLNINHQLADSAGRLHEGMATDGLHLTAKAYQVWADGLRPMLKDFLGNPAPTDHAPPPTGDPGVGR